jgi:hypothetical protein
MAARDRLHRGAIAALLDRAVLAGSLAAANGFRIDHWGNIIYGLDSKDRALPQVDGRADRGLASRSGSHEVVTAGRPTQPSFSSSIEPNARSNHEQALRCR